MEKENQPIKRFPEHFHLFQKKKYLSPSLPKELKCFPPSQTQCLPQVHLPLQKLEK